jgi:hypothetical protein
MRIALVLFFLLCGIRAFAESNRPTPSTSDPATQPKPHPQKTGSEAYRDKPTPQNYPPIIEIYKTPVRQVPTTDKTEKRHDYSSPEWWMVYITGILALITAALASYTGGLYRATKKLWEITDQSINLTAQSIGLTKQEFITSHPPKFRVHSIHLLGSLAADGIYGIQCSIDNIGGSTAHIVERNLTFAKIDQLPASPPYESDYPDIHINLSVPPGGETTAFLPVNEKTRLDLRKIGMLGENAINIFNLYFFGYIVFTDDFETERRIAFCRRYDIETERFTAVQDDDYEYSY